MMTLKEEVMYDDIVSLGIATEDEINLVFNCMCEGWEKVLNAIVYARTGYRSLEQYREEESYDD